VTVDELLSGEEVLNIAEKDSREKEMNSRDTVFGMLDLSTVLFFFLPFFAQKTEGSVRSVPLMALTDAAAYLKIPYFVMVIGMTALGIAILSLRKSCGGWWARKKHAVSMLAGAAGVLLFIISLQPYPAALMFAFLLIKGSMMFRKR